MSRLNHCLTFCFLVSDLTINDNCETSRLVYLWLVIMMMTIFMIMIFTNILFDNRVVMDGDVNDLLLMIVRLTIVMSIVMMLTMQRAQAIRLGSSEAPARHKLIAN